MCVTGHISATPEPILMILGSLEPQWSIYRVHPRAFFDLGSGSGARGKKPCFLPLFSTLPVNKGILIKTSTVWIAKGFLDREIVNADAFFCFSIKVPSPEKWRLGYGALVVP